MPDPLFTTVEFLIDQDQATLKTQTNGDMITIKGINLGPDKAAALAYLVNQHLKLKIEIKVDQ